MNSPYDELIEFVTNAGLSRAEADLAVRRCAMAMAKKGVLGYAAGGAISYFMSMNPATAVPYLIGSVGLGAGYALAKAPQCSEVRDAIRFWSSVSL